MRPTLRLQLQIALDQLMFDERIHPAPVSPEQPNQEHEIEAHILEHGETTPHLFLLANTYLRGSRTADAEIVYRRLLSRDSEHRPARVNLAVTLRLLGRPDEGVVQLKQVLLADPQDNLARMQLARAYQAAGKGPLAAQTYEELRPIPEFEAEALTQLGILTLESSGPNDAEPLFERAFTLDPGRRELRHQLAELLFRRSITTLHQDLHGGLREAGQAAQRLYSEFISSHEVIRDWKQHQRQFVFKAGIENAREQLSEIVANRTNRDACYRPALEILYGFGLLPEHYVDASACDHELRRWRLTNPQEEGDPPFAHFRLGLAYFLKGDFHSALEEFQLCNDRMLLKKQRSLKIPELLSEAKTLVDYEATLRRTKHVEAAQELWETNGIGYPFEAQGWAKAGFEPDQAAYWKQFGFSPKLAEAWQEERFEPQPAEEFRKAGIENPTHARRWSRADFSATQAARWREVFGEDLAGAVRASSAGFEDPNEAKLWLQHFVFPQEAIRWRNLGFEADVAGGWRAKGITDPFEAQAMRTELSDEGSDELLDAGSDLDPDEGFEPTQVLAATEEAEPSEDPELTND